MPANHLGTSQAFFIHISIFPSGLSNNVGFLVIETHFSNVVCILITRIAEVNFYIVWGEGDSSAISTGVNCKFIEYRLKLCSNYF